MKITPAEMIIMQVLWDAEEPLTSKEIMDRITDKDWKFTTLVTILGNLVDKDIVDSEKIKRKHAHLYKPLISKQDYLKLVTKEFIDSTHESSARAAFCAMFDCKLNDEQYERLLRIVREDNNG